MRKQEEYLDFETIEAPSSQSCFPGNGAKIVR